MFLALFKLNAAQIAEAKSEDNSLSKQANKEAQKGDFSDNISFADFSEAKIIGSFSLDTMTSKQGIVSWDNILNITFKVWSKWIIHIWLRQDKEVSITTLTP